MFRASLANPRRACGPSAARVCRAYLKAPRCAAAVPRAMARFRVRLVLTTILAFSAVSPARAFDDEPLAEFDISFAGDHVARLFVPVTFRETAYQFVIDTGSISTCFDDRLRPLLRTQTGVSRYSVVGGSVSLKTFKAPAAAVGAQALPPLDKVTCDDLQRLNRGKAPRVYGILGVDALRDCVLHLDFDRGKLAFLRAVPPDAGTKLAFTCPDAVPAIECSVRGGAPRVFVLDTGLNSQAALPARYFDALLSQGRIKRTQMTFGTTTLGRFQLRMGVLDGTISVGEHAHRGIVVAELPGDSIPCGVLGLDYLSRYVVTFDFPHDCVYLKPGAEYDTLRPFANLGGIRLARVGGKVVAFSVREDGFAAQWVNRGDILETIDAMEAQLMSDVEIVQRISTPIHEVKLVFRRAADGRTAWITVPPSSAGAQSDAPRSTLLRRPRRASTTR